jgi:hypothetical protein
MPGSPIEVNIKVAEGVGFEPTRERKPPGGFQDRCLKPLGHPSLLFINGLAKRLCYRKHKLPPDCHRILVHLFLFRASRRDVTRRLYDRRRAVVRVREQVPIDP